MTAMLSTVVGVAACAGAAQSDTPQQRQDEAPPTVSNRNADPETYWTEERMRDAKPFPMPQASEQSNDHTGPVRDDEPIESAPAGPPLLPQR